MSGFTSNNAPALVPSQQEVDDFVNAAHGANNAAITEFLDKYGAGFIDAPKGGGWHALTEAVWRGYRETVVLLLERGADINIKDTNGGKTPLMVAMLFGHKDIAILLLEKGADMDAQDNNGRTALEFAQGNAGEAAALLQQMLETKRRQLLADAVKSRIDKLKQLRPVKPALKKNRP